MSLPQLVEWNPNGKVNQGRINFTRSHRVFRTSSNLVQAGTFVWVGGGELTSDALLSSLSSFPFQRPPGWWSLAKARGTEINTTRKETFEVLPAQPGRRWCCPKAHPRMLSSGTLDRELSRPPESCGNLKVNLGGKKPNFWMGFWEEGTGLCELLLASSSAMEASG